VSPETAKGVLVDLDRTLVDVQSFTDYTAALAGVRSVIGSWPDPPTPVTGWDGPTRACMGALVALANDPRWPTTSAVIEQHEAAAVSASVAMPGLIEALAATAHLPRAVVTLLPEGTARRVLDRHGVSIDVLVPRRPDLSPKPAGDQLVAAADALGLPAADLVMVGDSTWDERAAVAAGTDFVGLRNRRRSEFASGIDTVDDLVELAGRFARPIRNPRRGA
jgi:phosphoglycolate phosphatase